ncbi:MAG: zinc ribbon domain-containing protein [Anaerolineales bacterium]|jgi:hypothetical protein
MMIGAGLLVILLFLVVLIGVPLLIIALITRGGLAALFKTRPPSTQSDAPSPSADSGYVRKCPTCGRGVKADWNVCPSCGAALH